MPRLSKKADRLAALRTLLEEGSTSRQSDLMRALRKRGLEVTQSSVSRDLKDLGVTKVAGLYRLPDPLSPSDPSLGEVLNASLVRQVAAGPHLLVLHTAIGAASRLALLLDSSGWPEIVGTIAGDDTIFVATPTAATQQRLKGRLARLATAAQ